MGKNISKNLNSKYIQKLLECIYCKYIQKLLDYAKQSATDALKTAWIRAIQKNDWNDKIADNIATVSKTSPQNNSEVNEEEILT